MVMDHGEQIGSRVRGMHFVDNSKYHLNAIVDRKWILSVLH